MNIIVMKYNPHHYLNHLKVGNPKTKVGKCYHWQ